MHADWLRAMVDKSTDHRNDVMVGQFVFRFLAHSIFPETSTEMVVKNCQCYYKKQIDNSFHGLFSYLPYKKQTMENCG